MPDRRQRVLSLTLTMVLLALNLAALNFLLAGSSRARLDLTEGGEYSIAPATRRLLESLDDELTIHGYFSRRTHPKLAPLVPQVVDLLEEYRAVSGGRVRVEIADPGEDEEVEREAVDRFGVRSTPFRLASKYEAGIVNAYFALVIRYGDHYEKYGFDDLIEVEMMPDGDLDVRLRNLEYDLTRAIKKVVYGFRNTAELFDRIDGRAELTAIVTPAALPSVFEAAPEAIRQAAQELVERSEGKLAFEELDPSDPAVADRVEQEFGAQPMALGLLGDDRFYLYLLLHVGNAWEQIPVTEADLSAAEVREMVESALRRHTPGFLKNIGVVAPEASLPPELMMQYRMQGMNPPTPPPEFQQVQEFLGQDYNVVQASLDSNDGIAPGVDVLVLLRPRNLTPEQVLRLDQYLMRGGRLILCTGSFETRFSGQGLRVEPMKTGLEEWLAHYGVTIEDTLVLDDRNRPLPVPERRNTLLGSLVTWRMAPYPYLVEVRDDGMAAPEVVAGLDAVGIYWGSPLQVSPPADSGLEVREILRSSDASWTSSDLAEVQQLDYEVPTETESRLLAASLAGEFTSFFAGKEVPGGGEEGEEAPDTVVLERSPETRLLVVGNAEFLSDFVARALGATEGSFFPQNLRFLENSIDWITLDNDLVEIRASGSRTRRLEILEKEAQVAVEAANYVIPAGLLLAFAAVRLWRRRQMAPAVTVPPQAGRAATGEA